MRTTKMHDGKVYHLVQIHTDKDYHYFHGGFRLKDQIKNLQGAKWLGYEKVNPQKCWRVLNNRRNNFNIAYLEGKNPFKRYQLPLLMEEFNLPTKRFDKNGVEWPVFSHQLEMALHMLIRRQCIIAGEMGTGKTLAAIMAMEKVNPPITWYVAPKSAIVSVKMQMRHWLCYRPVKFMTYDELKRIIKDWPGGDPPRMVIYDESSMLKTASSQRSQVADHLANSMRDAYEDDAYIIEMSGSPAPKNPTDWYNQCEIACPGYLQEGELWKFRARLSIEEQQKDGSGVKYNKHVAWKDGNPLLCGKCGAKADNFIHTEKIYQGFHKFEKMPNEVAAFYERARGLVIAKLKKDCLDLPEKFYREVTVKPSLDLLRAAKIVQAGCASAIETLTLLRELSDGFQYRSRWIEETCKACNAQKVYGPNDEEIACNYCVATPGLQKREIRETIEVDSPKLAALDDLLEENEEQGRIVIYAGFTASIDRLCAHVMKRGWHFIRVDGSGWKNSFDPSYNDVQMNEEFQDHNSKLAKVAFVAHPGSAGMGLTLTRACMTVYFSNDFNGQSRIQSEDRIHRPGMDTNKGATIVDLLLLPTDTKVLRNLQRKKELQSISMGEITEAIDTFKYVDPV